MSWARALAILALALPACDGCGSEPADPDHGPASSAQRGEGSAALDPTSPAGRAAAFQRALPEARDRAARRATLLSDGREHGRAGRHAEALRSFEDGLREVEGPDAALHCEAGYQAIQLGQWPLARRHLIAGLGVAVQPRRRAACFYNLALVEEAVDDRAAAIDALEKSLALRPNATVERKLRSLQAQAAEDDEGAEAEDAEAEDDEATEVHATLDEHCADRCFPVEGVELPERPEGWPELAFLTREDPEMRSMETTWLAAKDGDGWRDVSEVAMADMRDLYGAVEPVERIARARFDEGALRVMVVGENDEPDGEAEAYFECEAEHPGDQGAIDECFGEAVASQPPPEAWSFELLFELADGRVTLRERRAGPATQAP